MDIFSQLTSKGILVGLRVPFTRRDCVVQQERIPIFQELILHVLFKKHELMNNNKVLKSTTSTMSTAALAWKRFRDGFLVWKECKSPWNASPPSIDLHGVSVMLSVACRDDSLYRRDFYSYCTCASRVGLFRSFLPHESSSSMQLWFKERNPQCNVLFSLFLNNNIDGNRCSLKLFLIYPL